MLGEIFDRSKLNKNTNYAEDLRDFHLFLFTALIGLCALANRNIAFSFISIHQRKNRTCEITEVIQNCECIAD